MVKLFESDDYLLISLLSLFLLINFDQQVGMIYGLMVVIDWIAYYIAFDKNAINLIPIERKGNNRLMSLVYAMGFYVGFIFLANFITSNFQIAGFFSSLENISSIISTTFSATPILFGSDILKLVVWGIFIARIETIFFFRTLLQYAIRSASLTFVRIPKSFLSMEAVGVAAFFGAVFGLFHLVAKGITNNTSLLITVAFGFLSVMMVFVFKQVLEAVLLHIITNTIATMQQLQIGFFQAGSVGFSNEGLLILAGVISVSWFLLFQEIPLLKGVRLNG